MPLCTNCAHPVPHLYTIYQTAHNVRLSQCPSCHELADPYVEHDGLNVVLDLILLKRAVYRHLLFNRGAPPRRVVDGVSVKAGAEIEEGDEDWARERIRWWWTLRVGVGVVLVDAFIRWSQLRMLHSAETETSITWTRGAMVSFLRVLVGCLVETVAFHVGITVSSFLVLTGLEKAARWRIVRSEPMSGVRQQLRYSHISLCLLYSSLTKFFLLLLLSIWGPSSVTDATPPQYTHTIVFENASLRRIWEALDDDKLDREWVVRNVLGGMAAGFGLRVVLDCHPFFTTLVILSGWGIKTVVASVVSGWVGEEESIGETWLAYSIP
ncbi:Arv1-domain-containing protein [Artomyces pyxidatus]|uniref:Arv1-domain-containing protein n=1 Tax=Artomyces pyxidatus TaxID=48021 RepID=A0ACB8STX5_9AGAM|nr:Arv1-domain-containing protein [Artomyces pyxidatus]